jgi:sugar (pentulose or hexulose) kinase
LTGFTAPKILWVKENEPDICQSRTCVVAQGFCPL